MIDNISYEMNGTVPLIMFFVDLVWLVSEVAVIGLFMRLQELRQAVATFPDYLQ